MVQDCREALELSILNWNPSRLEGPELLHELVNSRSEAPAIDFLEHGSKRRQFSYRTLHALSDALAEKITTLSETLENASQIVPVLLPQCPELYVVLLAILKAGKAFCPLNLDVPEDRLNFILKDISADFLITQPQHKDRIHAVTGIRTLSVDHELFERSDYHPPRLPRVRTEDLAYVLYTSGSTGLPKAVSVTHRAVTQSLLAHDRHIPQFIRFLQFAAPTFDVSIFEIFFPWYRGCTLVGSSRTHMLENLPSTIQKLNADAAELTPTVIGNLLQGRKSVPGLRLLLTIGEMLTQHVIDEFGSSDSQQSILWAMYGPTEAAVHCTLQPKFHASCSVNIIGYPLDTVSTLIIDPSYTVSRAPFKILPIGEEGELVLGGYQLAEGYLNRPDLTAASFINHPEYGCLYRTGDRAKINKDGTLECLGRVVAGQVKLRGQRVEIGEIEQSITRIKGCRAATVIIINDSLIAFCAAGSGSITHTDVLQTCKRWLPNFMIPSDVHILPALPQLPSGKVDKKSLETQYLQTLRTKEKPAVDMNDHVGTPILLILREVLGQDVFLDTHLSSVGLDSLRAIPTASKLRLQGYNIGAVDVLSADTVRDLIAVCKQLPTSESDNRSEIHVNGTKKLHVPEIRDYDAEVAHVFPCTPLQEAMLTETTANPAAYCNWIEVELSVSYTYTEIRAALSTLVEANEILRSGFCPSPDYTGAFIQIVWKSLGESQVQEVTNFSRNFSLASNKSLLRPLAFQVMTGPGKPRFLLQIHHALYDGWSFDLLLHDLDKTIRGFEVKKRPQFREVVRYYSNDQRTMLFEDDKLYWADLLRDSVPTRLANYNGHHVSDTSLNTYSTHSTIDIQKLSRRARDLMINPQVLYQAAVGYILGQYLGTSDVMFGNVTSGRTIPITGIEDIIGPCIASVPFRFDLRNLASVRDLLAETQRVNRESLRHSALPLRDIVRTAGIQPGQRLFDVLFVWQQSSSSETNSSLIAKPVGSADHLEFKLTLEFEPREDCVSLRVTYDPSTMPKRQIEYLSRQIDEVVTQFLTDIDCRIMDIGKCFTTESRAIANPHPLPRSSNHGLSHAVEQWAVECPDKEAVIVGRLIDGSLKVKDTVTYTVLNARANQLARVLQGHGVAPDHLVGIVMEKSVDLYVSILAVLKLGAGYLPLVPETPAERIRTILTEAEVTVCISQSAISVTLRDQIPEVTVDIDLTDLSSHNSQNLDIEYNGSHIAYAVFTSGSTGTPKGVLVTQENLASNLDYLSTVYPTSPDSRMLQSCSQAFDVSVFEIFFSWHVGMCLCTATKEDLFHDFEAAINNLSITHLSLTPTVAALVDARNVPKVEFLVTAGEALTEHVRREWAGRGLYQGYGPSETTNICTVRPSVSHMDLINNIGAPFDNTSAFVLDPESDIILPRGAIGELCFGGTQVFRGYLNRPELNTAKIIDHPLYGRIYRSGDMGLLLPDNNILSTGRSDDQVKIRGQRVELGEITSIVLDNEDVQDCTTLLLSRGHNITNLVSFWVPRTKSSPHFEGLSGKDFQATIQELFASLSRLLPVYMVPSYLLPISQLPMTAQAKIDKRLLRTVFQELSDVEMDYAGPAHETNDENVSGTARLTEWEKSVADVLIKLLNLETRSVRRNTSFFNLGLDSVSAIRFCNALRSLELGDYTITTVLKNPAIAHLAGLKAKTGPEETLRKPLLALDNVFTTAQASHIHQQYRERGLRVEKILPCTPLQEAMLASGQSSKSTYSNTMIFNINGDPHRLQQCWTQMIQRHQILRTSFTPTDHSTYAFAQVVVEFDETDWDMRSQLIDSTTQVDQTLFELLETQKPPLYLAIQGSGASTKLVFGCHHALYDGIAISTLLQEIQDAYHGSELPPPISYHRYLEHMISQDTDGAHKYWATSFADFEPSFFPDLTGSANKHSAISKTAERTLQIPLEDVRKACQSASVTTLSVIQAAWAKLLHFYIGEDDLCFGNIVSGRSLPGEDLSRVVAPCFNTLPVRIKFDFHQSNIALSRHLHLINVESLDHQLTALRRIQNIALKEGGRLFDTLVILQQPQTSLDESIWTLEKDVGEMDLPVVCEIFQDTTENALKLVLHYHTDLISEIDAGVIAETFDNSLADLISLPNMAANSAMRLPAHLQAESNPEYRRFQTQSDLLHSAFERNASSQPERIALDFLGTDGQRVVWSYHDLNKKANGIAQILIEGGIGPEDIVPIHLSKTPAFYCSILGVLKAGAAFAPIHPELPEARKRLMLQELKPKVVLCSDDTLLAKEDTLAATINLTNLPQGSTENPFIDGLGDSDLAYCLYTSGSTGVPKAVSMEHGAPVQTIESSRSLVPWDGSSRLLQYAAITFDMCYYDCFLAWTLGFTLCAAEQQEMLNELPRTINSLNIDLLDLTPSVAASLSRSEVPSVKWLYCIGEAMSASVVKRWAGACVNSYGPTEAAFCTTIYPVPKGVKTSVIGKPFPTTTFAVYGSQCEQPLPLLSVGELYIGGAQLARGYLGKQELTAERFIHKRGERFYRTGDTVRMLSDGNFEFIGRKDDQVKIRGLRVELGEINHILQDSDVGITDVTTQILKKEATAKDQLVAFLVTQDSREERQRLNLRNKVNEAALNRLPAYMVPQFYIFVDDIPKSMAGKVDKKQLATLFCDNIEAHLLRDGENQGSSSHEWTEVEINIREIFARLSKVSANDIHPTTTIYELGMDSISAVQVAAALRKSSYHVSASDVMKYTTCATLAKHAVESSSAMFSTTQDFDFDFDKFQKQYISSAAKSCGIEVAGVDAIYPCTPLQKGMISQFIGKGGETYLNHLRLHMSPGTNLAKIRQAWVAVMKHHRMLRTGFTHIQDVDYPFLMVCHTEESSALPWSQGHNEPIEDWLRSLQCKFLDNLHQPLWEIRVVYQDQHTYLDLAIFHALFDAHSLDLIFRDVGTAYHGTPVSAPVPFAPLLSNILHLSRKDNTEAENFWCELGRSISSSRFPNLTPLREQPESPVVLTKRSSTPLHDLQSGCRKGNITLQSAGVASWSSIVSAYTGEPTVTIGVVLSGRNIDLAENAVFPCINTVPFPCTIAEKTGTTLRSIMELNVEIQKHQFTPLSDIQRLIGRPNEPIFDSIFAYQKSASKEDDNDLWRIVDENATTEYPISIELEPKGEQLEYRLTFFPHIIPREQGRLILDQLDHLLHAFIFPAESAADGFIYDELLYSITPPKEQTLPSEVNLLHEFVEFTANNHPHQAALEFADSIDGQRFSSKSWTYQELNEEGNRIAHLLLSRDIQPGNLIGVCFEKCPEASFATLGILKVGCAFVAIDPGAPSARQAFIVKDSGALAVLSMREQSNGFGEIVDVPVLNLDETTTDTFSRTNPTLQRAIEPQDRSYCLYTSGTTGTPKGCELTHENAVQALLAFQRLFAGHWDANSRWLQFASFHFDVSVLEQYWSWSVGICVVSAPRDLIFEDLANSIRTLNITHIDLTPSLAQTLHPDDVPSLCKGVFITGGESLKQEILDAWGPKGVIYNGYGPTEATIGVTMYPRVPSNGKPSNIGPQFDNVGSFVLRPGSNVPVLRGAVGELCVSGKLVGKGYLNRMELTEERFPHLANFDERVYRTGDLVRILYNGTFDFLGRADDQVKLRGQRLETGEINSVIRQSGPAISDVATLVLKHPKQQKEQLVAFVVVKNKLSREPQILETEGNSLVGAKEACHERLPPYMVPTHFIPLTSMPLNVNNKSDGKRLKGIYENISANDLQRLSTASNGSSENLSDLDNKIVRVLKEAMAIGDVTIEKDTNFFELGMDSISVIGVSKAMKEADFKNASVALIMRNPTIRQLAKSFSPKGTTIESRNSLVASQQAIDAIQHRHRRNVAQMMAINPQDIEGIAPCTPLQQGMIARYLDSDDGLYFNTFEFRLHDHVKEDELQAAWTAVYTSTQILRTVFMKTDDGYVQAALRNVHVPWRVQTTDSETLSQCIEDTKRSWIQANSSELVQPFEVVLVTTPQERLLLVHIFHALYDGISIDLMFQSVWNAYRHREIRTDAPSFQSALACGPLQPAEGAKSFWETHLPSVTSRPFPVLANETQDRSIVVTRNLSAISAYDSTRRKLNVTAQAIAQACWLRVLQEHYHSAVTVGMVVSGRNFDYDGADRIAGPLFNTIPYQYHPLPREAWSSVIHRVHEFNLAALPYQHTPLRDITKWCKRSHDQPLFDTLFVYQIADENREWTKNNAWELQDGVTVADYPLAFEIEQRGNDNWALTLVTQGQISDMESSSRLLQRFEETLKEVLADPTAILETKIDSEITATNGVRDTQVSPSESLSSTKFVWTPNAIRIRGEIALLANTEAEEITEMTSILELGLDSIDAIKLSSKLKKHGITLPVSGVMRGLTVKGMEQNISDSQSRLVPTPADMDSILHKSELKGYIGQCGNDSNEIDRVLPLTPLQEAMVAEMVASDFRRYYNHDVLRISQDVDIERLRDAWSQVVAASPILRTSFVEVDNPDIPVSFAQIIHVYPHDFWTHSESDGEPDFPAIFESLRTDTISSASSKPPFGILLVQCPVQSYIVLSIAHALYDGHSLSLLHSDVMDAYRGQYSPRPDYEPVLADILSSSSPDAAHFWQDYLMGTKSSPMLRDSNKQHESPDEVHRLERASVVDLSGMVAFVKRRNVSLQTLGQTVFALTLAWYTHSLDVVFGSVLSGRDDDTRTQLLLPTMNTVAIRTILHGTRSEMLQYVQENFTDIHQWQHYPLRKALSAAKVASTSINSLFIYQKNTTQDLDEHEHEKLYESTLGQSDVEYPVCVEMEVVGNTLMWRCAIKDRVLSGKESHAFLGTLDTVLGSILAQPNDPTIETTPQGTSICGLPAFERENPQIQDEANEPARQDQKPLENMPRLHTEDKIREILAMVSRIPEHEIETGMSIYHIGLDSISAIKVSSLLRKQGVTLSVGEMLKAGTVENMALIAEQHNHTVPEVKVNAEVAIREALHGLDQADLIKRSGTDVPNIEQILPVSGGQLYMLSMWVNSGGSNFYPEFKYELKGSIALHTIRDSWQTMVETHPILRTTFVTTKNPSTPYVQIVLREVQSSLINLTGMKEEEKTLLVEQHASHQPWAHVFVSRNSTGWAIQLKIHHALYDGVSLPLMMQGFEDCCNSIRIKTNRNILVEYIASGCSLLTQESRKSFWCRYLEGIGSQHLNRTSSPATARAEIFKPGFLPTSELELIARRTGISMQALFLAAYAMAHASSLGVSNDKDIVIGVYLANRSLPLDGIASATVPTVNILPIRIQSPLQSHTVDIAIQIQHDLRVISQLENVHASLFEINTWTGVKVDSFVNFLSLPDTGKDEATGSDDTKIKMTPVEEWGSPISRVVELHKNATLSEDELDAHVNGTYLHAIDIEATVRNDCIDVGIFGPSSILSLEAGEQRLKAIKEKLQGLE